MQAVPNFRRSRRGNVLIMLILIQGCSRQPEQQRQQDSLDTIAHTYVRLAVALGEHDKDSLDYSYGNAASVADVRRSTPSLTDIRRSANESVEALNKMHPANTTQSIRIKFLVGQLHAVGCRASLLAGGPRNFDAETSCSFGMTVPSMRVQGSLHQPQKEIGRLLPGTGPLHLRYAKFESQFIVPPANLRKVMKLAVEACRKQTAKYIALPPDESVDLQFVSDRPWAAYSLYLGEHKSTVSVNLDFPVTIDRALDLACHEAYPGHHTFNLTQDDVLVRTGLAPELSVQPTYSPQSFVSEGAASIASTVVFSPVERLRFEQEELLPAAGLPSRDLHRYLRIEQLVEKLHPAIPIIARDYLDDRLEFARASSALESKALMGGTFEVLKYLNEFRTYVVTYTVAPDLLMSLLPGCGTSEATKRRWVSYAHWMHSESDLVSIPAKASTFSPLSNHPHQESATCME